jgi:hypothetical protein
MVSHVNHKRVTYDNEYPPLRGAPRRGNPCLGTPQLASWTALHCARNVGRSFMSETYDRAIFMSTLKGRHTIEQNQVGLPA